MTMAIAISYTKHTEDWMCATLQTGDTLGTGGTAVHGPATLYIPVDGGNLNYQQVVAQGLLPSVVRPAHPPKPV
jgi:hypothetical protein